MRQFLLGLSISIAFILGCVTAQHIPTLAVPLASATPYTGQRWEYSCQPIYSGATSKMTYDIEGLTRVFNEQGAAGWEIIPDQFGNHYCFKRPR